MPALEPLISKFCRSGLFTLNRLRGHWSVIAPFEGRFCVSLGLGPLEGLPYLVRDRAI
jgi:hypothetical protein